MFLKNYSGQEKVLEQCDKNYKFKITMKLNRTKLTQLFEMISEEEKNEIYYVMAIIVGILIIIYPNLISYILGLALIIYGALMIIK